MKRCGFMANTTREIERPEQGSNQASLSQSPMSEVLLLRYSDFNGVATILEHQKVIDECGSCWWAKIGKKPSPSYLQPFIENCPFKAFLYTAGVLHKCTVEEVSFIFPPDRFPSYYLRDINQPSGDAFAGVFFRLSEITSVDLSALDDYVVKTSGKTISHDLKKSISSYYTLQLKELWIKPEKKVRPKPAKLPPQKVTDPNACKYRIDGKCSNRRCVNYLYECDRPSFCIKRKPI